MEIECLKEFPHPLMDRRPRKRPRLGWDVDPLTAAKVLPPFCSSPSSGFKVEYLFIRFTAKWVKASTFGQVLECWDREREEMVAIKIVRGINKYREAAMIEINMLQQLGKYDKNSSRLGLGWSYPCDIWSVGCILVELCSVCLSERSVFVLKSV
ncbi:hypothetical protein GW17_00019130 [Ensete ventricosum]|nr:hypothetical protein GW17_00019130 [Ensete ventricosum]